MDILEFIMVGIIFFWLGSMKEKSAWLEKWIERREIKRILLDEEKPERKR